MPRDDGSILADRFYRRAWLPIPIVFFLAWAFLTIPAWSGTQLEGGGSPWPFLAVSLLLAAVASAVALVPIVLLRRLAAGTRPGRRTTIHVLGLVSTYLVALLAAMTFLVLASWGYDH